ncbi:MAG TPA: glycosyltransferase [Acidimicrobiales bacterium]|nr:glycosyltransferase [Acidimicrobiales bacterium]
MGIETAPGRPSPDGRPRAVRLGCFIGSSAQWGGMETVAGRVLAGLPQRYEVTVIAVSAPMAQRLVAQRPGSRVLLLPPISGKKNLLGISRYLTAFSRYRPDVLLAHLGQLYAGQYALLASATARIPTLVAVHGVLPHQHRSLSDPLLAMLMRRMAGFVGVSPYVCRVIEEEFGVPVHKIRLVPNGVPDLDATARPARHEGPMVIGAVGRLAWEKGLDILIRAMASLPDCRLILAGEGPCRGSLEELSRALGVEERVAFVGLVDASWPEALGLDVVAVPSRNEGFGLTGVEAMRAGLPVVASDVGGIAEVLGRHGTVFVPPEDPEALAGALRVLAAEPERRAALGEAARAAIAGRYTVEGMVEGYVGLLDSLVA